MAIFKNDPFSMIAAAFSALYPGKEYEAYFDPNIQGDNGEEICGFTEFSDEPGEAPIIFVKSTLSVENAAEIFAHELAHVAVGIGEDHGEAWERAFSAIHKRFNEIGQSMFSE